MRKVLTWTVIAVSAVIPLWGADWPTHSGDNQRSAWQRDETRITKDTVKNLQLLWKIKLDTKQHSVYSLFGPLILERAITDRGFKELAFVAGSNDDLFAVDADLGTLFWKVHFDYKSDSPQAQNPSFLCPGGLTATPVLQPAPARGRGPGGPPAVPAPAAPGAAARGAAASTPSQAAGATPGRGRGAARGGGGPFAIRPVYTLTSDGLLRAINVNTGDELAPPMKFLPPNGKPYSLAWVDNVIYTITGQGCGGNPNSAYSLDLNDPANTVRSWRSGSGGLWGIAGPAIGSDGTVYAETGDGQYDPATNKYANAIVALTPRDLKLKDWYAPTNAEWLWKRDLDMNVTPVVFQYKGRDLIAGSGKEGRMFLLDSASLGGADHRTPLFRTDLISNEGIDFAGAGTWGSLASYEDSLRNRWVLAPVYGPPHPAARFELTHGAATHGSIAAFRVVEKDGKTVLSNAWISRDLITPAPPAITNGIVFALGTGEFIRQANDKDGGLYQAETRVQRSQHATLYALDGVTGEELWSSKDLVGSFTHFGAMAIANGRVYFTTYDNTLYCFGIPMEH
ncbi:MAG TPA: PQQ-binding-like beta-propeller repeat protein [Vicinamibacterales bacterium]|nr:PQQ-binding-like beta-propeller repeat protein [Vicinamibacterales bacterium]